MENYLKLYWGKEVLLKDVCFQHADMREILSDATLLKFPPSRWIYKLILRELKDITPDELTYIIGLSKGITDDSYENKLKRNALESIYLIDRGLDLFDLIQSDKAIDIKSLSFINKT